MISNASSMNESLYLEATCKKLLLSLSEDKKHKLIKYLNLIQSWSRAFSLLSFRDQKNILPRHFFDSLSIVNPIENGLKEMFGNQTICDIGSGNGFPGVILSIMKPSFQVICVDSKEKKVAFITQVRNMLHLKNLSVKHGRAEDFDSFQCDIVISRAFSSLEKFISIAGKHVQNKGFLVAMKGKKPNHEVKSVINQKKWKVKFIEPITVPDLNEDRCLIWMQFS